MGPVHTRAADAPMHRALPTTEETSVTNEFHTLTAVELLTGYRSRSFAPSEVVTAILKRIDQLEPTLNAFYRLEPEFALQRARESDARWAAGRPAGAIDGVPVTLKENIATVGAPLPSGTAAGRHNPPATVDGPVAAFVNQAGGVRLGKTVMPDYGMLSSGVSSLHGVTRSPWNSEWTTGGSSAGAGAAAAGRLGPLHVGSDIGGSLRLPATWGGLITLKPSFGLVPVDPPYIGRVIGPLTRTVADAALFMNVLAKPDARDYTQVLPGRLDWSHAAEPLTESEVRSLRVAVHTDAGAGHPTDPVVAEAVRQAAAVFEQAGALVEEIPPFMTQELLDKLDLFLRARSWLDVKRLPPDLRRQVLPFIQDWVITAADHSGADIIDAYQSIQTLRKITVTATADYDLVLSPVSPIVAFPADWPMPSNDAGTALQHIAYTAPYNFSEQPASSVNCGFTDETKAIGLQIAGPRFADVQVLRATAWYELARPEAARPLWP